MMVIEVKVVIHPLFDNGGKVVLGSLSGLIGLRLSHVLVAVGNVV